MPTPAGRVRIIVGFADPAHQRTVTSLSLSFCADGSATTSLNHRNYITEFSQEKVLISTYQVASNVFEHFSSIGFF